MPVQYTDEMIAAIKDQAPMNLEKAKRLAEKWDIGYRSIISKCRSIGVAYEKKAASSYASASQAKASKHIPGPLDKTHEDFAVEAADFIRKALGLPKTGISVLNFEELSYVKSKLF